LKRRKRNDLSPEEIVFSRKLQGWFDMEQEELPPFYLDTLNNPLVQEASWAADSLEERITRRVFKRIQLSNYQPDQYQQPINLWPKQAWSVALITGIMTLFLLVGLFLFAPVQERAQKTLEALSQPRARPTRIVPVEQPELRSFASIWEAQPYVDFAIVPLQRVPKGFELEEVRIRGTSAAALEYRRWNEVSQRWERLILLEFRTGTTSGEDTPFPTPRVVGPEQELAVDGLDISLVRHEATPDAEGTAQARWQADGLTFCLYGPLSTGEVQALAEDVLRAFDE
jgi:hypothetical protein